MPGDSAGPVSPEIADSIRASLERPPRRPSFDVVDAVALPFRILVLPLRAVGIGLAELAGLLVTPETQGLPPFVQAMLDAGFRPGLGTIGPRSGITARLAYGGASPLFFDAAFSIRTSQRYQAGLRFDSQTGRFLEASYTFRRNAAPHFWGTGPDAPKSALSDYLWDQQQAAVFAGSRVALVRLFLNAAYEDNRVGRSKGRAPDMQADSAFDSLYGVDERVKYATGTASLALDFTRQSGFQERGFSLQLGSTVFRGVDATDSDFHRFDLILRGYVPLNRRQQFAFQFLAQENRPDGGQGVPFYHLARLGSEDGARSLNQDRFRDLAMAALMTEWRYEVWRELQGRSRVEAFFLFDIGAVNSRVTSISLGNTVRSYGFGWRIVTSRGGRFVTYMAFGKEELRFRVKFETAY